MPLISAYFIMFDICIKHINSKLYLDTFKAASIMFSLSVLINCQTNYDMPLNKIMQIDRKKYIIFK